MRTALLSLCVITLLAAPTFALRASAGKQDRRGQLKKIDKSTKGGVYLLLATPDLKDKTQVMGDRSFLIHEYDFKEKLLRVVWERAQAGIPVSEVQRGQCRIEPIQISIDGFYEFKAVAGKRTVFEDSILYAPKPGELADLMIAHGEKLRKTMKRAKKLFEEIEKASKESKNWPEDGEKFWAELKKMRGEAAKLISNNLNPGSGDETHRNFAEFSVTNLAATTRWVVRILDEVLEIGQAIKKVPEKTPPGGGGGGGGHEGGGSEPAIIEDRKGDRPVSLEEMRDHLEIGFAVVAREELSWEALLARQVLAELADKKDNKNLRDEIEKILKERPDDEMSLVVKQMEKLASVVRQNGEGQDALRDEVSSALEKIEKRARGEKKK